MKALFFSCVAVLAFCVVAPGVGQETRPESARPVDESIFNVREGAPVAYYQGLQRELRNAYFQLPQDEKEAMKHREKVNRALREVNRNLAYTCLNATTKIADEAFSAYCKSLSAALDYQEMLETLAREKERAKPNLSRISYLEELEVLTEIAVYGRADDADALSALGDRLIEEALAEPARGERYSLYLSKMRQYDSDVADAFVAKAEERFNATDDRVLRRIALSLGGEKRYAELVGSEMTLEGLTVLGKDFDWSRYKGKTVLVVFFASDNRQTAELFRVPLALFSDYRDSGFDIVGYCVDDDPKSVSSFDRRYPYPWTTLSRLLSREAKDKDYVDPTAYYDLRKLPIAVLIGKGGKVVDADATNADIQAYLRKEYPNVK